MKTSRLFLMLTALTLLGAGCSSSSSATPSPSAESGDHPTPSPAMAQRTDCGNPYYPLKQGTKMTYATHMAGHDSTYSYEVTEATDHSAKLAYSFGTNLNITSDITCDENGIHADASISPTSNIPGGQITSRTISANGDLIPHDLQAGDHWTSKVEVETTNSMPQAARLGMGTGHSFTFSTSTVIGEESVTVPAGTFTAMKVESKILTRISFGSRMAPVDKQMTTETYFVRGKGMVKSTTNDGTMPTTVEATEIITP
jgi:hypothetical protein